MGKLSKKLISVLLSVILVFSVMTVGVGIGTIETDAASWNGTNYGGGKVYGYRTFLEAFGIDYDTYMKWMDDHDADSDNPDYYLGTPYAHNDHRNPNGDCAGARGAYDTAGVPAMNCTGFVWHVLYKSAVNSGATSSQISQMQVMGKVPTSWANLGIYRIYFNSVEEAYESGVLEKGDLMWLYGTGDNHNAIFYGDSPEDFIYWDSAGERNRYCEVHAIGESRGLYVAKVTQPDMIELQIDTPDRGYGDKFGARYCIFNSKSEAQAAINNHSDAAAWNKRVGSVVLDRNGHGCYRQQAAPAASQLWTNGRANTNLSYFSALARKVDADETYYAVQWSSTEGIPEDNIVHEFKDSGRRTSTGYRIFSFNAPYHVNDPAIKTLKSTSDGVRLNWDAVRGAEIYRIYYKNRYGSWTRMAQTTGTSYLDTDVIPGTAYTYTIRCVDRDGNFTSDCDTTGWRHTYTRLDTPEFTGAESTAKGLKLSWDPIEGAELYRVYYKNGKGSWTRLGQTSETEFTDTEVQQGGSYTYTVRCVDAEGDFVSKYNENGVRYTYEGIETPQITEIHAEPDGIRMSWESVDEDARYRVYTKQAKGWKRIGETDTPEFFDEDVTPGETYTYTVRCVNSDGYFTSDCDMTGTACRFDGVDTPVITGAEAGVEDILLTWEAPEGASRFRVYRHDNSSSWVRIGETDQTAFRDGDLEPGKTYTYTVRCVNGKGNFTSDFDHEGVSATYIGVDTPVLIGAQAEPDGVRISWEPVENAVRYRVYYKRSNGGWSRIGETEETSFFDDVVSPGGRYTYTVRCVNDKGGFMSGFDKNGVTALFEGVETPRITESYSDAEGVHIGWQPVENAQTYRVYIMTTKGWTKLADTEDTSFTDTVVNLGKSYTYTLRCINAAGSFISDYDKNGATCKFSGFATPVITETVSEPEGVRISWDAIDGVPLYRVYYKNRSGGWTRMGETSDTEFIDEDVAVGASYTYTLRCVNNDGNFISDFDKTGVSCRFDGVETPRINALISENEGIRVKWTPISDALTYCVYRMDSDGWNRIAEIKGSEYLDNAIESGKTYTYTLRCMNSMGKFVSDYVRGGWSREFVNLPTPQVTLESTAEGIRISWDAIEGAPRYRVFYKAKTGWVRLGVTEGTEMMYTDVEPGSSYTFTVRCLGQNDNYIGDYNHTGFTAVYDPPQLS